MGDDDKCIQGEVLKQRVENMEKIYSENKVYLEKLNDNVEKLPNIIKTQITELVDLKIDNKISKVENKFYRYIGLGALGLLGNLIFSLLNKFGS